MTTPHDDFRADLPDDERDERLGALLRRAMQTEAAGVQPQGDGLARIRGRVERRRPWWQLPALAVAAACLLGLLAGLTAVVIGDNGEDGTVVAGTTSSPTTSPSASTPASPTTSATPTGSATSTASTTSTGGTSTTFAELPVYFVRDDTSPAGPRLYREFHRVTAQTSSSGRAAVEEMLRGRATDPDYSSPWPTGARVRSYRAQDGVATVDLAGARTASAGSRFAELAVQQLVYTVTAADRSVTGVRLLLDGRPAGDLWGAVQVQPVERRAPMLDVQGLLWILEPRQEATVGRAVRVTVYGTAFEGNVVLKVLDTGGKEVASTFVTTAMGEFREASTTITLPPGRYLLTANDTSGQTGALLQRDSKAFTVR